METAAGIKVVRSQKMVVGGWNRLQVMSDGSKVE